MGIDTPLRAAVLPHAPFQMCSGIKHNIHHIYQCVFCSTGVKQNSWDTLGNCVVTLNQQPRVTPLLLNKLNAIINGGDRQIY